MRLSIQTQIGPLTDATRARVAMVRSILLVALGALPRQRAASLGGGEKITLADLAREYRAGVGTGDCGICFEYAVHDAIRKGDAQIHALVSTVLEDFCGIREGADSILLDVRKGGPVSFIETPPELLTDESRILVGRPSVTATGAGSGVGPRAR